MSSAVHFRRRAADPYGLGRKAMQPNKLKKQVKKSNSAFSKFVTEVLKFTLEVLECLMRPE